MGINEPWKFPVHQPGRGSATLNFSLASLLVLELMGSCHGPFANMHHVVVRELKAVCPCEEHAAT